MNTKQELPVIKGKLQKVEERTHSGRIYPKPGFDTDAFDKAALAWQKEQMVDIQGMIRQKADEIATRWEKEFKEEK